MKNGCKVRKYTLPRLEWAMGARFCTGIHDEEVWLLFRCILQHYPDLGKIERECYTQRMMQMPRTYNLRKNLFILLLLCFGAAILGDSTAEALLLAHFNASYIPRMFLVNAAVLFALSAGMLSLVDRIDRGKFFCGALLVHGVVLLALRLAISADVQMLFLPLFSYAYSTKILFFLLFWTVANDLIDSRRAGTEFPVIAAGGTIGAIVVSFSIPALMRTVAVENLLTIWAVLVLVAALLLIPLQRHYKVELKPRNSSEASGNATRGRFPSVALLRDEPLIRSMSILYFLVFFLLLNQHVIFYRQVKTLFATAGAIAAFLGKFNGISMLTTCLLQLGVAGVLLKRLGSTRSMLLLPSALFTVFVILTGMAMYEPKGVAPLFWAIIIGMGARIAMFDAFFSPNFQIFFSSLPRKVRGRGKLVIEGFIKPFAMVVAGCWLLWVVPVLTLKVHLMVMVLVAAGAVLQTLRLKSAYTRTLGRYLTGFTGGKDTALFERFDLKGGANVVEFLAERLENEDFEVQKFIVEMLSSSATPEAVRVLCDQLHKGDGKIRATVVAALGDCAGEAVVTEEVRRLLLSRDDRVVANAVLALVKCNPAHIVSYLTPLLNHAHNRVRANAILSIWPNVDESEQRELLSRIQRMLFSVAPTDCASALFVVGELQTDAAMEMLVDFCRETFIMESNSVMIVRQVVSALGKKRSETALDLLLQMSEAAPLKYRKHLIATLTSLVAELPEQVWLRKIVSGSARRRNSLARALLVKQSALSTAAAEVVRRVITNEIAAIGSEKVWLQKLRGTDVALLAYAVREEFIDVRLETILTLVALLDPSGGIHAVTPRINHTNAHVRARAFEVLENSGDVKSNRLVLRCIESLDTVVSGVQSEGAVPDRSSTNVSAIAEVVAHYRGSPDAWVAACAAYEVRK